MTIFLKEGLQDDHAQIVLRKPQRKAGRQVGSVKFEGVCKTNLVHLAFMDESENEWFCHPMRLGENLFRNATHAPSCWHCIGLPSASMMWCVLMYWQGCWKGPCTKALSDVCLQSRCRPVTIPWRGLSGRQGSCVLCPSSFCADWFQSFLDVLARTWLVCTQGYQRPQTTRGNQAQYRTFRTSVQV